MSNLPKVAASQRNILQIVTAAKADDQTVAVAAGWTDILTQAITTTSGVSLSIQWGVVGDITIGGAARVLIHGGAFSNAQVGCGARFAVHASSAVSLFGPVAVASSTAYTVKLQVEGVGVISSVQVNASSDPTNTGARLTLVEYV